MGHTYAVVGAGRQGTAAAYDMARFGDAAFAPFTVESPPGAEVTLRLAILDRTQQPLEFGEKFRVREE